MIWEISLSSVRWKRGGKGNGDLHSSETDDLFHVGDRVMFDRGDGSGDLELPVGDIDAHDDGVLFVEDGYGSKHTWKHRVQLRLFLSLPRFRGLAKGQDDYCMSRGVAYSLRSAMCFVKSSKRW